MTPRQRRQTEALRRLGHALTQPATLGFVLALAALAFFVAPVARMLGH